MCDEDVIIRSCCVVSTKKDNGAWLFFRKMRYGIVSIELFDNAFKV
jgi:hypothetical protein